ncbi:MAG TPA: DUF2330 domain-containing protein [Actinomycetota bacterium]
MRPGRIARRALAIAPLFVLLTAVPALACGGLVTPNGTVNLVRTTTLAAYHRGIEHYVTSFEFAGKGAGEVGSIVPLPGVPTKVVPAGEWTLQRLLQEVQPPTLRFAAASEAVVPGAADAVVLFETEIDALDITVLKGGGDAVGRWASDHGYFLPPDAPEVLDFYANRSPIFLAARFNAERAAEEGVRRGQGTPIHVVVPTPNPWVPLRILALGRQPTELIEADVFLLTDRRPATLPQAVEANGDPRQQGLIQEVSDLASSPLLSDLSSDRGMKWVPDDGMWLTYLRINETAANLQHDLAIDASGYGQPDPVAAGYVDPVPVVDPGIARGLWFALGALVVLLVLGGIENRRRSSGGGLPA